MSITSQTGNPAFISVIDIVLTSVWMDPVPCHSIGHISGCTLIAENNSKKLKNFCRFKKKVYLCIPLRKQGYRSLKILRKITR